jgi:hypothetical protein
VPNHQSLLQSLDEIIERMGINGDTKNILKVSESLLKYSLGVLVKRKATKLEKKSKKSKSWSEMSHFCRN